MATDSRVVPRTAIPADGSRGSSTTRPVTDGGTLPAIAIEGLSKSYGDVFAVEDVSLSIDPGTVVGVLGPNGAGKTTLIKSVLGLVIPSAGSVSIGGVDVHANPRKAYRQVGAVLEGARNVYWRLSVRENLAFFARLSGLDPAELGDRHDQLLERFDLDGKGDVPVNDLSRGMKQKVALACTLARETPVVFLDEPTLGLDVESSLELRRELRRFAVDGNRTVVLSSHDMDVIADLCDRVVVMNGGRVVADGSVDELLDAFRTQAYRVTVERPVDPSTRNRLAEAFAADEWEPTGDRLRFSVSLSDGDRLHELTGLLREAGVHLVTVDPIEPDLESAFLRIVEGSDDAARDGRADREPSTSTTDDRHWSTTDDQRRGTTGDQQ